MVSVIIPVYNVEQYIRQCIDSAIDQTYKDIEIILVDDGSTDNSGTICDEYAERDRRIKVIHKKNGGLSDARNAGMNIARGKYIYFLDSDDYIKKNALEELVSFSEKEQAEIVSFSVWMFSDDKNLYMPPQRRLIKYPSANGAKHIIQLFKNEKRWFPGAQTSLFRADYLKKEHLSFKKGIHYEDLLFSGIAYIRAERVSNLCSYLYYYRQRSDSIMRKSYTINDLRSYCECIKGFTAEKKKCTDDPVKTEALDRLTVFASDRFINTYAQMKECDRKGAERYIRYVLRALSSVKSVRCETVKIKLTFPGVYSIIRKILLPLKRALFG